MYTILIYTPYSYSNISYSAENIGLFTSLHKINPCSNTCSYLEEQNHKDVYSLKLSKTFALFPFPEGLKNCKIIVGTMPMKKHNAEKSKVKLQK